MRENSMLISQQYQQDLEALDVPNDHNVCMCNENSVNLNASPSWSGLVRSTKQVEDKDI